MSSPDQIRDQMKEIISSQTDASARLAAFGTLVKSLVDASDVTAQRMRGMPRMVPMGTQFACIFPQSG